MKKILISGGAGYLGSFLSTYMLKKFDVVVYDEFYFPWILKNKKKIKFNKRLTFIKKNILDVKIKDFKDIDTVCDLNGIPNDPASELNKKLTWKINYHGRKNFAKIAKKAGVKRYIFNSTCSVYGFNNNYVNENSNTNPLSTYAKANFKAEKYIYKLKSKNFTVNVLRNSTLFGFSPEMRLDLVINKWVHKYIRTKKIHIDGDGKQWRPFISVNDISKIYNLIIIKNHKSYICNLVSFNLRIKDLASKVCRSLGVSNKIIFFNKKNVDHRNYKVSNKRFTKIFKNFKFANFNLEIKKLRTFLKKTNRVENTKNIRMKFYKKKF